MRVAIRRWHRRPDSDHPLATLEAANDCLLVGYFPRHSYEALLSLAGASLERPENPYCCLIERHGGVTIGVLRPFPRKTALLIL